MALAGSRLGKEQVRQLFVQAVFLGRGKVRQGKFAFPSHPAVPRLAGTDLQGTQGQTRREVIGVQGQASP